MDVHFLFQNINFCEIWVSRLSTSIFEDRLSCALSSEDSYRRFYGISCRHLQRISQQCKTPYPRTLLQSSYSRISQIFHRLRMQVTCDMTDTSGNTNVAKQQHIPAGLNCRVYYIFLPVYKTKNLWQSGTYSWPVHPFTGFHCDFQFWAL